MADVSIHYYDGGWVDLTDYTTRLHTEDAGLLQVPSAVVNFEAARSDISSFIANPYTQIRIRAKPAASWQNIFFGYVNVPYIKTEAGTLTEHTKISLDVNHYSARLCADYTSFNYYELQQTIAPYTGAESWTFRKMLEDILEYPDSRDANFDYGIEFDIEAAANPTGIDAVIDGVGNWRNQTVWEAIHTTCEHIGYDGYIYRADETSTPKIRLYPYDKASTATLANPFIGEPEWIGGALDDIANKVWVEGDVDVGFPSAPDKWTEYAVTKYSPAIWYAAREGGSTTTITDVDNTVFDEESYRLNSKCIQASTTNSTNHTLNVTLDFTHTEAGIIDGRNRIVGFTFAMKSFGISFEGTGCFLNFYLKDSEDNEIVYHCSDFSDGFGSTKFITADFEQMFTVQFTEPTGNDNNWGNVWYQYTGSAFDFENIVTFRIQLAFVPAVTIYTGQTFGLWIDQLQFTGGQRISWDHPLNPPVYDQTSINTRGIHCLKTGDSEISSFEQAQAEATRLLNNLKNPIPTLKVKKLYGTDSYGTTWSTQLYPSNVVSCLGTDYRVGTVMYDWDTKNKLIQATYKLVGKTSPLPPIWSQQVAPELRPLLR